MTLFKVEIAGICCHYRKDRPNVRTILIDASLHPMHPHIAHIEVQHGSVIDDAGLTKLEIVPGSDYYSRDGITYEAYRLNGHNLTIPSNDSPQDPQPAFKNYVPHLPDICPTFGDTKILDFVDEDPSAPVAAQLDIPRGELSVAEYCDPPTHFDPIYHDPPSNPGDDRPLATIALLTLNIGAVPLVKVKRFGGTVRSFKLQPWVTKIRIGNLSRGAMRGIKENDADHFLIYYEMADVRGGCTAKPKLVAYGKGLNGGCSNTQFP